MLQDQDGDGLGMARRPGEPESALEPGMSAPRKEPHSEAEMAAGKGIAPLAVNIPDTSYANVPAPQPGAWTYDFDPSGPARASFNGIVQQNGVAIGTGVTSFNTRIGAVTLTAADVAAAGPLSPGVTDGGFVNKLRNGTFDVWQRGTSVAVTAGLNVYTADGWQVSFTGANSTVAISGNWPASYNSLQIKSAAGVTGSIVSQRIESFVGAPLANQICTVQFKINSTVAMTPQIGIYYANAQDNFNGGVTAVVPYTNVQPVPAGTALGQWTTVAYTFQMPQNAANGVLVALAIPATAFSSPSNYVNVASADLRATPSLTIGLCLSPPPPELRPIGVELALCQRYYWDSSGNGATTGFSLQLAADAPAAGSWIMPMLKLPVTMRIAPALASRNATYNNASTSNFAAVSGDYIQTSIQASAAGQAYTQLHLTASAEL